MLCTQKKSNSYKIPTGGIKIKNSQIDRVTSVKYLGLIIDHKLNWHEHINEKINTARKMLFRLKNFIGKTWGPSPKLTKYAYTSSVRPIVAYGSFAFSHMLTKGHVTKLKSFQRKALMMMGNFRQNTPGDALEVITDTMPLDLFIKGEAAKATFRISPHFETDKWETMCKNTGHIHKAKKDAEDIGLPLGDPDEINEPIWEKGYIANTDSDGTDIFKGLRCYTDGSKTSNGCGAGTCIAIGSVVLHTRSYGLSNHSTVFQTEARAITLACSNLTQLLKSRPDLENENKRIVILSDSKAVISALDKIDTTSKTISDTKNALNTLAKSYDVEVRWLKGHSGIVGNEIADRAAKTGCNLKITQKTCLAKAATKEKITQLMYSEWQDRWSSIDSC